MSQPNKISNLSGPMRSFASITAARTVAPTTSSSSGFRTFPGLVTDSHSAFSSIRHSNLAFSRTPRISRPSFSRTQTYSEHPYMYTKKSSKDWDQPIFAYSGDIASKISAAGILYYKKVGDKIQVLVFQNQDFKKLEDLGGKTDIADKSPLDTACREAEEETKNKISRETSHKILKSVKPIYISESSYLLYIAEATEEIQSLVQTDFGSTEECNNKEKSWTLNRIIDWMPLDEFIENTIGYVVHPRLTYALSAIRSIST